MKLKILAIGMMLIMIGSTFVVSANVRQNDSLEIASEDDIVDVRVAIYTDEKEDADFYSEYCYSKFFMLALKDFSWTVGNTSYRFVPKLLSTKDILRRELTVENYDVLIYTPYQADEHLLYTGLSRLSKNKIRVRNIVKFIEEGGGYFGTCGGAFIAGGMKNKPKTYAEWVMKNSQLGISAVNFQYNTAIPLLAQIAGETESAGFTGAYIFYCSQNEKNPHALWHSGACLNTAISRDNPIFDDYLEDTRKIRWLGGPAFEIPENKDRDMTVLVRFPEEEISTNETMQIYHWKYVGGVRGLIKGIFGKGEIYWYKQLGIIMKPWLFAGDWENTNKIVQTNVANKPFMTSEVYPNENMARIVRCAGHPEFNVWWGGHTEEFEDTDENNLFWGFHRWVDVTPFNETHEDEFTYNYWINRRSIAWASQKVSDNDLPPIYGPSQVSDIYPYEQSAIFTVEGNVKTANGITSTELFYRHSNDTESWGSWTSYGVDDDGSDGWSWDFEAPVVPSHCQFYSIRNVQINEYEWLNETAPPGPDAIAYVS